MHQSLLTRGQGCQCGRHNNQGQDISPKMPNVLTIGDRLNRHDRTMHNTRPDRGPDKASVRHWITRGDNQKHTERCIDAHDQLKILGATSRMPRPTRGPENREWPKAMRRYLIRSATVMCCPPLNHPMLCTSVTTSRVHWKTRLSSA